MYAIVQNQYCNASQIVLTGHRWEFEERKERTTSGGKDYGKRVDIEES